ncbi:adenylyl-sulfate kinase [Candidatus Pelagibacter sp. HIMB1587]|uniref:adenylyl-sulfate kinase n=1 Tax=Candidatus Pelagibacter sp. HIMB1587 TaxID=3413354 RepID=UPI003F847783
MKKNISSVIWITGLSGSGKTTISRILKKKLSLLYKKVIHLDGDELRACASTIIKKDSFHRNDRKNIGLFYSKLAKHLAKQNFIVIMSVMALQREVQNWNKVNIPHFYDVMLDVPINELKLRDPKGIYKKYSEGKIKNLYGLDLQYDKPKKPWMNVKWSKRLNKKLIVERIMNKFIKEKDVQK